MLEATRRGRGQGSARHRCTHARVPHGARTHLNNVTLEVAHEAALLVWHLAEVDPECRELLGRSCGSLWQRHQRCCPRAQTAQHHRNSREGARQWLALVSVPCHQHGGWHVWAACGGTDEAAANVNVVRLRCVNEAVHAHSSSDRTRTHEAPTIDSSLFNTHCGHVPCQQGKGHACHVSLAVTTQRRASVV